MKRAIRIVKALIRAAISRTVAALNGKRGMNTLGTKSLKGPYGYENWRSALNKSPALTGYEINLYSDAHVTGEIVSGLGPYEFLNPISIEHPSVRARPAIVLRFWNHIPFTHQPVEKTDESRYHGGTLDDELAALLSLELGIRSAVGGEIRAYYNAGDPKGVPRAEHPDQIPYLPWSNRGILPYCKKTVMLSASRLATYPQLDVPSAIALLRSARNYQQALWIADADPNLAWLLLVSAVETAANHWNAANLDDPVEALRSARPLWAKLFQDAGGELENIMANELHGITRSFKKYVDFLLLFIPPAPNERPYPGAQVEWTPERLKLVFKQIYTYRSKALHGGKPFPLPMCLPAGPRHEGYIAYPEIPSGLATAGSDGQWLAEDTPILLHTFEYIVRGALQRWWDSMAHPVAAGSAPVTN